MKTSAALQLVCVFLFASQADASDWPQFRGSSGSAVLPAIEKLPTDLKAATTVWKTELPGTGWSSPVFVKGKIWVTTALVTPASEAELAKKKSGVQFAGIKTGAAAVELKALCVDAASGKVLHDLTLRSVDDPDLINPLNSYASPTPALAGGNVVCHFGNYGTWCLDASSGELQWENRLEIDHSVGPGSSPVIAGDKVLLVCDGTDYQYVAALGFEDGSIKWKTNRPRMDTNNGEFKKAYSTPLLIDVEGKTQAVIPGAQWVCGYDPDTGEELWRIRHGKGFSTTPMAVAADGLVIISTGFMRPMLVAINPAGQGDVTESHIVWKASKGGSTMPTAVAANGVLFSLSDDGILTMLDTQSGEELDRERIGGKYAASPLLVGNRLFLLSQEGVATVFETNGSQLEQLSKTKMDGQLMASPAVLDGDLIIRSSASLARFRK